MTDEPALLRALLKAVENESAGKGDPWWVPMLTIRRHLGQPDSEQLRVAVAFAHTRGWLKVNTTSLHFVGMTESGATEARRG
jgi:hypothetical protein